MLKLLVVEDDRNLNQLLIKQLSPLADQVVGSRSLSSAYRLLKDQTVDLAVIDRRLGDGDGLELVEYLSEFRFATKVIILSQLDQVNQRIKGLSLGADDYLGKPFHPQELYLRVKKLLSKQKLTQPNLINLGRIKLDLENGRLMLDRAEFSLRKKELEIMTILMQRANQITTYDQITKYAWPREDFYPTQTTISVYIRRLRSKLGKCGRAIQTIRKFGYRLNLSLLDRLCPKVQGI